MKRIKKDRKTTNNNLKNRVMLFSQPVTNKSTCYTDKISNYYQWVNETIEGGIYKILSIIRIQQPALQSV